MTTTGSYSNTAYLALCGLFAALNAICAWLVIPLGISPVPVTLGTLGVFMTGGILGKKYGAISMAVYVLLGAVGVPVFAGFTGGPGILLGPTGGYLLGYIAGAFVIGAVLDAAYDRKSGRRDEIMAVGAMDDAAVGEYKAGRTRKALRETMLFTLAMSSGLIVCYGLGTIWFMINSGTGLTASLTVCVLPFLPGDALKILAAVFLTRRLRPMLMS